MTNKNDPLNVLLSLKNDLKLDIDDGLVSACYKLQRDHQYDKDRDITKQMEELIEKFITANQGEKSI